MIRVGVEHGVAESSTPLYRGRLNTLDTSIDLIVTPTTADVGGGGGERELVTILFDSVIIGVMHSPDFLFPRFLVFPPANPSNF